MINLFQFLYIIIAILFKILRSSSIKALVAENILLRQQLIILTQSLPTEVGRLMILAKAGVILKKYWFHGSYDAHLHVDQCMHY
jgi:hypothetical protein